MKNVLITGATGFIGSHVVKKLLSLQRYRIRIYVRPQSDFTRIKSILPRIQIMTGDLCQREEMDKSLKGMDILIHLASILKRGKPKDYQKYNIGISKDLFLLAVKHRLKNILYLSSLAVVKPTATPYIYTEQDPTSPDTHYGRSKVEVERFAQTLIKDKNANITILRPPAVYGEEDNFDRGFIRMIHMVARNKFIPFHNMKNFMSLIYIGNLLDAIMTCLQSKTPLRKIYFVADKEILTTGELYHRIAELLGARKRNFHVPTFLVSGLESMIEMSARILHFLPDFPENFVKDMTYHYMCSNSLFQSELKWTPPFSVFEGLKRTVDWYRTRDK